jgi:hypothetical protein
MTEVEGAQTDSELALHTLLVLGPVLLFDPLIILECRHKILAEAGSLHKCRQHDPMVQLRG